MQTSISAAGSPFEHIQRNTRSSYIKRLRVRPAPAYELSLGVIGNAARAVRPFHQFCRDRHTHRHNAFVIEIADPAYGVNTSMLAIATLLTLNHLSAFDPADGCCMASHVGGPGWMFSFSETDFMISVFAPCLAPDDPGDTFGLASTFLLFRPARPLFPKAPAVALPVRGCGFYPVETLPRLAPEEAAFLRRRVAA